MVDVVSHSPINNQHQRLLPTNLAQKLTRTDVLQQPNTTFTYQLRIQIQKGYEPPTQLLTLKYIEAADLVQHPLYAILNCTFYQYENISKFYFIATRFQKRGTIVEEFRQTIHRYQDANITRQKLKYIAHCLAHSKTLLD